MDAGTLDGREFLSACYKQDTPKEINVYQPNLEYTYFFFMEDVHMYFYYPAGQRVHRDGKTLYINAHDTYNTYIDVVRS